MDRDQTIMMANLILDGTNSRQQQNTTETNVKKNATATAIATEIFIRLI